MNVKTSVLSALAQSGESFISGTRLADSANVSRNAVWKAVKALEAEGFLIDAVSNKGYRISPDNNKLCPELISAKLRTSCLGRKLSVLGETDSTNNYAKKLASAGAVHGMAVIADSQTSGRGRLGRGFFSPPGTGLYMSVIIRPDFGIETAQLITSCAACAAAEAAEALCGHETAIKWVNDLYMNGRKICGILTEASLSLETKSLDYAVIGIGINVLSIRDIMGSELVGIASSIEDETGVRVSRNALCAELLNRLERRLADIGSRSFLGDYRRRELLTGNTITANAGGEALTGKAVGIDENAALILELPDGSRRILSSGEANLCRIKKE
ncbi:MAG: biotin--[Ruminococcus sp.]|nr:biotin--[acetyl-CoA-carboxylase] ligase [Ruminococcus sp.]